MGAGPILRRRTAKRGPDHRPRRGYGGAEPLRPPERPNTVNARRAPVPAVSVLVLAAFLVAAGCGAGSPSRVSTRSSPGPDVSAPSPTVPPATIPTTLPPPTLPPPAPRGSGVYGYVTAGPTCPVERPGQPCPPRPLVVTLQARDPSGRQVGAATSDAAGRYLIALPPGRYTLTAAGSSPLPRCPPTMVTIDADTATRADINCDTGIR